MAVVAFILGGFVGAFGALLGWVFWDMSLAQAFGFYIASSLSFASLALMANILKSAPEPDAPQA